MKKIAFFVIYMQKKRKMKRILVFDVTRIGLVK